MTRRTVWSLLVFALLGTWASGQGPPPGLSAGEQLRLLGRNIRLLDDLVDRGLGLSSADTPLSRVDECRQTADRLGVELRGAVSRSDADRVNEISDHVRSVVVEGLVPNLRTAREQIRPGSPDYVHLQRIHGEAAHSLGEMQKLIPNTGDLARQRRIQDAREKLSSATQEVGTPDDK